MTALFLIHTPLRARLFAFVLVVVCALAAAAQQQPQQRGWLWQNPLPQGNAIYAVRFAPDKLTGWAVGADGVIRKTEDGGYRWREQRSPATVSLYGLYVKEPSGFFCSFGRAAGEGVPAGISIGAMPSVRNCSGSSRLAVAFHF